MKALRRLSVLWFACLLLFCGCADPLFPFSFFVSDGYDQSPEESTDTTTTTTTVTVPANEPLALIDLKDNRYFYEALTEKQQQYYDQILDELYLYSGTRTTLSGNQPGLKVTLRNSAGADHDMLCEVMEALQYDHPELFYLQFTCTTSITPYSASIEIPYYMNLQKREARAEYLKNKVFETAEMYYQEDLLDWILWVHDNLLSSCFYNDEAAENLQDEVLYAQNSSASSVLCDGKAICGGYTRAMQLILTHFGVPNTVVYNDDHIWNLVWIDGEPYHLDATWNDKDFIFCHAYFFVTTEDILKSREIPEQLRPLPEATATAANYHRGTSVTDGYYYESVYDTAFLDGLAYQMAHNIEYFGDEFFAEARFSPQGYQEAVTSLEDGSFFDLLGYYETDDSPANDFMMTRMKTFEYYTYDDINVIVFRTNDLMLHEYENSSY